MLMRVARWYQWLVFGVGGIGRTGLIGFLWVKRWWLSAAIEQIALVGDADATPAQTSRLPDH